MAEVRTVLRKKVYGILKPEHCQSWLDLVNGQCRTQCAVWNAFTLRKTEKVRSSAARFRRHPPSLQEHGTDPKLFSLHRNVYGGPVFWKRSDAYLEDVGMCIDCKSKTLPRDRPVTRTFYPKPYERIWWNTGTIHQNINVCRTRRDQTRTFCTLRYCTGLKGYVSPRMLVRSFFRGDGSYDTPLYKSKSAYYEILEVSPTATHAQIKTAYYKQSFIYHPDKNAGSEEATLRFSEISEAYNILGNKSLRKKYDRGILTQTDVQGASRPSPTATSGSGPGQQTRSRSSSAVGGIDSKKVFDFDNYIKTTYGEQLQRERFIRSRQEARQRHKDAGLSEQKFDKVSGAAVAMLVFMSLALFFSLKSAK